MKSVRQPHHRERPHRNSGAPAQAIFAVILSSRMPTWRPDSFRNRFSYFA
jgi:hypothetical protein